MKTVPIVGIGASAGGLREIEKFFRSWGDRKECAFVVIQHLSPDHKSLLPEIITRFTNLEVSQVTEKVLIKTGHIFIIPPGMQIELIGSQLTVTPGTRDRVKNLPIDIFFTSMSKSAGEKGVAVILSGTGTDGSRGLRKVKDAGGLVIVQTPETAEYSGMPDSAIGTGLADYVCTLEEMPDIIARDIKTGANYLKESSQPSEEEHHGLDTIFKLLKSKTGNDFSQYKKKTIKRRLNRRLTFNKIDRLKDYIAILESNPSEIKALFGEFIISVTGFFRDRDVFEVIRNEIIPQTVKKAAGAPVRVWIPACATGEEAYSFAILLNEYLDAHSLPNTVQIFASDIDLTAIEKARRGVYPKNIAAELSAEHLAAYFDEETDGYRVKKRLRDSIVFAEHNLLSDPPYSRLDIISCRNLLIYLDTALQQQVLSVFHYTLLHEGILVLGKSETPGKSSAGFTPIDKKNRIFKKVEGDLSHYRFWQMKPVRKTRTFSRPGTQPATIAQRAKEFILENLAPPSVVIDSKGDMLFIQGKTGRFLENPSGEVSTNILRNAREGLRIPLTNGIRKCRQTCLELISRGVRIQSDSESMLTDISIAPFPVDETRELFIISFHEVGYLPEAGSVNIQTLNENQLVAELEKELLEKDEYLRHTIEELESTNEELKSANEEAQSTNEELQSTNEELETSREELQSLNEELITTNAELNNKVEELDDATSNLKNLLAATEIATLFLDEDLNIFNFTPSIRLIVNLYPTDIGRPLAQFSMNITYPDMMNSLKKVQRNQVPVEAEVQSTDRHIYWMRIAPYRNTENNPEGLVVTFTDITEKRKNDFQIKLLNSVIDNALEGYDIVNDEGLFVYANPSYLKMWGYSSLSEVIGTSPATHCADPNMAQTIIEQVNRKGATDFEFRAVRKDGSEFDVHMSVISYIDFDDHRYYAGFSRDITERKIHEEELKNYQNHLMDLVEKKSRELTESERRYRKISEMAVDYSYSYIVNEEGNLKLDWLFGAFEQITGYPAKSVLVGDEVPNFIHPDDIHFIQERRRNYTKGLTGVAEVRIITRSGEIRWIEDRGVPELDPDTGRLLRIVGTAREVTARKRIERELKVSERKFRNIAENIPGLIMKYVKYPDGTKEFLFLGQSVERIFEISHNDAMKDPGRLWERVHEEDREGLRDALNRSAEGGQNPEVEVRLKFSENRIRWIYFKGITVHDEEERHVWDIIVLDITERKETEESLRQSTLQREILLKELHHRVKNNLQLISSMLRLQAMNINDVEISRIYAENQDRIHCIAKLHEILYTSNNLSHINIRTYLLDLVHYLVDAHKSPDLAIKLSTRILSLNVSVEQAIPLGLIVNELVNNSLKHAFRGKTKAKLELTIQETGNSGYELLMKDDGTGMDPEIFNLNESGFGSFIVKSLVMQVGGELKVEVQNGTLIQITLPSLQTDGKG